MGWSIWLRASPARRLKSGTTSPVLKACEAATATIHGCAKYWAGSLRFCLPKGCGKPTHGFGRKSRLTRWNWPASTETRARAGSSPALAGTSPVGDRDQANNDERTIFGSHFCSWYLAFRDISALHADEPASPDCPHL